MARTESKLNCGKDLKLQDLPDDRMIIENMFPFYPTEIMSDRPKIHVFLGAPPPSSVPASASEAGLRGEERPPAGWRHLELCWQDGRLRHKTGEALNLSLLN